MRSLLVGVSLAFSPGEYVISAVVREPIGPATQGDLTTGYAPTYYPGTARVAEAQALTAGLGVELPGVDFSLLPTRTSRITGTVLDSTGRPLANATVGLIEQTGSMTSMRSAGMVRPDGSFTISGVAPGEYIVRVGPAGPPDPEQESAIHKLVVTGQDIVGLHLVTTKGTPLSGRIVFEGATTAPIHPSALSVFPQSREPMMFGPGGMGRVKDDWTFRVNANGEPLIRVTGLPPGWMLKSVTREGTDITDTPIEVKGTEEISGLEIVVTNRTSQVIGTVMDDRGQLSRDYTVVIFADDRERWQFPSRFIQTGRPDQEGLFKVQGLPPATYLAIAADYIPQGAWTDPEFLDRLQPRAFRFSLDEGETETVNLKLTVVP